MRGRGDHRVWMFDKCDAGDIRFTIKGNDLYAITLGWPDTRQIAIETLGKRTREHGGH